MQKLLLFFLLSSSLCFSQHTEQETLTYQENLNAFYQNPETTPLKSDELANFEGIQFFPYNEKLLVVAPLQQLDNQPPFKMPTTGTNEPYYRRFGILHFEIDGKKLQLEVYQNIGLMNKKGFEKHLFLPFIDLTSGNETYGGGRYLDIEIPESDQIILDFNQAYHPYCAYTIGYSCPITPDVNFLTVSINAGVKF